MAKIKKNCRICGKEYTACSNAEKYDGVFRWQVVACSPECGEVYYKTYISHEDISSEDDENNEDLIVKVNRFYESEDEYLEED